MKWAGCEPTEPFEGKTVFEDAPSPSGPQGPSRKRIGTSGYLTRSKATRRRQRRTHCEVPPAGLEPAPRGLKGRRSNQLSYRGAVLMVEGGARRRRSSFCGHIPPKGRTPIQERSGNPS